MTSVIGRTHEVIDWNLAKDTIRRLYMEENKSLQEVRQRMNTDFGFNASKNQLETHLKKWNFCKNLPKGHAAQCWKVVKWKVEKRKRKGKDSKVYKDGKLLSLKKLRKEMTRSHISTMENLSFGKKSPVMPPGIIVRSPTPAPATDPLLQESMHQYSVDHRPPDGSYTVPGNLRASLALNPDQNPVLLNLDDMPWQSLRNVLFEKLHWFFPSAFSLETISSIIRTPRHQMLESDSRLIENVNPHGNLIGYARLSEFDLTERLSRLKMTIPPFTEDALLPWYSDRTVAQRFGPAAAGLLCEAVYLVSNGLASDSLLVEIASWLGREDMLQLLEAFTSIKGQGVEAFAEHLFRHFVGDNNIQATEILLENDIKPRPTDIHHAVKAGHVSSVKLLSEAGIDMDLPQQDWLPGDDPSYLHPLAIACSRGDVEMVRLLLELGADPNVQHEGGLTALQSAANYAGEEAGQVARLLLERGAMPRNKLDWTPPALHYAAWNGNWHAAEAILEAGENINRLHGGVTATSIACWKGDLRMAKFFMRKDPLLDRVWDEEESELSGGMTPLQSALRGEMPDETRIEIIQLLLDERVDVHAPANRVSLPSDLRPWRLVKASTEKKTALQAATELDSTSIVKLLLDTGVDLGRIDCASAVQAAIRHGNQEIIKLLMDNGASLCDWDSEQGGQSNFLVEATKSGQYTLVKGMLEGGAYVNSVSDVVPSGLHPHGYRCGTTPLYQAVLRKDLPMLHLLLSHGAVVNFHTTNTILQASVASGDAGMVDACIRLGADLHDPGALCLAVYQEDLGARDAFLQALTRKIVDDKAYRRSASKIHNNGQPALSAAIGAGDIGFVRALVHLGTGLDGASVSWHRQNSDKPLHVDDYDWSAQPAVWNAVWREREDILLYLLRKGADVNSRERSHNFYFNGGIRALKIVRYATPLQEAARRGSLRMVKDLLTHDAAVNSRAKGQTESRTALQAAVEYGSEAIVRVLLDHGADVDAPPAKHRGVTALQVAAIKGHFALALLLLQHGADVNAAGAKYEGRTALEGAAEWGRIDMVQLLFKFGARFDLPDPDHCRRVVRLASKGGHHALLQKLKMHLEKWNITAPVTIYTPRNALASKNVWEYSSSEYHDNSESEESEVEVEVDEECVATEFKVEQSTSQRKGFKQIVV